MHLPRCSGILLHPTSLPGRYGIGSFNHEAFEWVDFLERTNQSLWQVLPLGPTGYGDSPYQSFSTFAGNPYLIGLEDLVQDGLLDESSLGQLPETHPDRVDYGIIYHWKLPLLAHVASTFQERAKPEQRDKFELFCQQNASWLDDYALFMALKEIHHGQPWNQWAWDLRSRQPEAVRIARNQLNRSVYAHKLNQWHFDRQWSNLKQYANSHNIRIIGDVPIYVAMDSADVWANPEQFFLDSELQPTVVAGVPPDYFSKTGQLWGNPLYRWLYMQEQEFDWWVRRVRVALRHYDIVRFDHFRGFAGYWEVAADEKTAANGRWVKGPGANFFEVLRRELGELPLIAEDLGDITPDVIKLRKQFGFPGMKVLQFAFGSKASHPFLPHNYPHNCVVYPGTHDNDTSEGWYQNSSTEQERDFFRRYFRTDGHDVAWTMIEAAFRSVATVAIITLQDLLGLNSAARMNVPGAPSGNWTWRYKPEQVSDSLVNRLTEITALYGRDLIKSNKNNENSRG
ncbi:4-alpha-glucanotransferase [Chloroflexi bacterium TSY]|nr:4-alpha-glucanotransferase [Chloroflexi bacterium TSY]